MAELRKVFHTECPECDLEIALGWARSIAHLKCFFLVFRATRRNVRPKVRRLLFGSANATHAAFSGELDAELLACIDLHSDLDSDLSKRLGAVSSILNRQERQSFTRRQLSLRESMTLALPDLRISPYDSMQSFDAWL